MLLEIFVRDIHNYTIKPFDNGRLASVIDSMTQKLLISDTELRSFIPPQVCKTTPKLRHICGYEICTIPKDTQIDLNLFKTRLVTDLQHNYVGRDTNNTAFSTTSDEHYKDKIFHMVNVYTIPSTINISESPVLILHQRI